MSSADKPNSGSSSRVRPRESDNDQRDADPSHRQSGAQTSAHTAAGASPADSAAQVQPESAGVQPLPEQLRKRPRRSPRLNSPLDLLAAVELQLALQWLDSRSRLAAARCSRRLLQAASAPFAWRDAPPMAVTAKQLAAAPPDSPLLRLIPLSLHLGRSDSPADLTRIAQLPTIGVRELRLRHFGWREDSPLSSLLQRAALQSLQVISAPVTDIPPHALRLVAQLPRLRSLSLLSSHEEVVESLRAAPALTHLGLLLPFW